MDSLSVKEFIRDPWVTFCTGIALGIIFVLLYQGWLVPLWNKFKKYMKRNKTKVVIRTITSLVVLGLIVWVVILLEGR